MAEGPVGELQQTQTAENSPTAAELTDPGGSTSENNGYTPMKSIVNNGYTPMASLVDTAYTPMSPIVDNGYTPMASLQKASEVPPPLPPKKNRPRQGGPSLPPGDTPREPPRLSGETLGEPPGPSGETPPRFLLPKRRNAKRAGVYWMREEDIVNLPLNPMYNADLDLPEGQTTPKEVGGPSQAGGPDDGRRQGDQAASGPATHTYEDGDAFGMRLGPPLKGDPRSAPPVPSTPRPGRTTDGAQPVAAATHVYEDGESFGMRLGPALNRDAPAVPSTPRPGRPTGGAQQVPGGPNPLSNPQDVINQLQPNPMYNSNQAPQAPGSAKESSTIWGRLRRRLSRRPLLYTVMSLSLTFVTTVSLAIVVPVLLTHFNRHPGIHGSPATTIAGPKTTDSGAWQSSAVLMGTGKVTSADVIKVIPVHGRGPSLAPLQPATATAGPKTTDSGAWKCSAALMGTDKVTSADVIKVSPVHGRGPSAGITSEMEAARPAPINMPGSTGTGETSDDKGSRPHIITFGNEPGAGKLRSARGVAVSPDNKIWVADRSTTHLKVYSMEGVYLYQFPQAAPGLGYPSKTPSDVSIDRDGHLWVLMLGYPASPNSVVQVTRDGHLKANFDLPDSVPRGALRGMAVGLCNNHVYVTWSDGHSRGGVQAFTPDGNLLWNASPRMKKPMYVAVDGKGNVLVSDFDTNFIYMYDETGRYMRKFGGPGLSGGRLNRPEGICVDRSGHIMVVDELNKRVVMYTGRGEYVRHIALRAESPPAGVAVGPGGQLVVAHSRTITVFPRY